MKFVRAPFTVLSLIVGLVGVLIILMWVSLGGWWELALRRVYIPDNEPGNLLIRLGLVSWLVFGLMLPAWVGYNFLGIAGGLGAPLAIMVIIALVDRW